MAKDYTDIVLLIFDSGDRILHYVHLRNRLKHNLDGRHYPLKGQKYLLTLDRAYWVRWAPWDKWKFKNPIRSLRELSRSKKIGLLLYQMPSPPIPTQVVIDCECSCGFKGANMAGTKVHIGKANNGGHVLKETFGTQMVGVPPEFIEPIHVSRQHQPSGEMRG